MEAQLRWAVDKTDRHGRTPVGLSSALHSWTESQRSGLNGRSRSSLGLRDSYNWLPVKVQADEVKDR